MEKQESPSPDANELPYAAKVLPVAVSQFSYSAQTDGGLRLNGTIEAPDGAAVVHLLESMRMRVIEVAAVKTGGNLPRGAVRDQAFLAFNQQLALLVQAGLPIEAALLTSIAALPRRRRGAVKRIAAELKSGVPLAAAFEKYRGDFPPLYGQLIDAGVRGGNLPAVLLELGPHLETQRRLSAALWKSVSYPMMTLCGLLVVLGFMGLVLIPRLQSLFADMHFQVQPAFQTHPELPAISWALLVLGGTAPYGVAGLLGLFAIGAIAWIILRRFSAGRFAVDWLVIRLPVIGPPVRMKMVSRWLAAVRIGILTGSDLPDAIRLAGETIIFPFLRQDGADLVRALANGEPLSSIRGRLLPATVPFSLDAISDQRELPRTLQALTDLYERQTQLRVERVPAVLIPLLVIVVALAVTFVTCGILWPLFVMIKELTNLRW